jgi:hypothetical protein
MNDRMAVRLGNRFCIGYLQDISFVDGHQVVLFDDKKSECCFPYLGCAAPSVFFQLGSGVEDRASILRLSPRPARRFDVSS